MKANYFEASVKYTKINEKGKEKKVRELYLLDALSFTEGEARITEEMKSVISGDYFLATLKNSNIIEIIPSNNEKDDRWYKVKVMILDEEDGKEKSNSIYYLVAAADIKIALENMEEPLSKFIVPYEIESICDSKIIDVFPYLEDELQD
ncbi:MAG: DUF4494 domain-containing protein [Muribaculaceae bacterium]